MGVWGTTGQQKGDRLLVRVEGEMPYGPSSSVRVRSALARLVWLQMEAARPIDVAWRMRVETGWRRGWIAPEQRHGRFGDLVVLY